MRLVGSLRKRTCAFCVMQGKICHIILTSTFCFQDDGMTVQNVQFHGIQQPRLDDVSKEARKFVCVIIKSSFV